MIHNKVIVLRTIKYSESDLIVHGLSVSGEKLHFIAKGALRSRKRFGGGVLEPTHYIRVSYTEKRRGGDLYILNEASLLEGFSRIRNDYERLELGFYFLRAINKVSLEGVLDSHNNFNLLGHSLRCLEITQDLNKLRIFFETKLLQQQGVLPGSELLMEIVSSSILDHERMSMDVEKWSWVSSLVHHAMQRYLEG